jgi:hypothetical protein
MSKYIKIKPGLKLPVSFTAISDGPLDDHSVRISAELNPGSRKYEINEIAVVRDDNTPPLNGTMLRGVRVQDALENIMRSADIRLESGEKYEWPYSDFKVEGKVVTYKPKRYVPVGEEGQEVRIRYAAEMYAIARAFGLPELREVTRMLGISQSTATRLMRQARERSLIDDA